MVSTIASSDTVEGARVRLPFRPREAEAAVVSSIHTTSSAAMSESRAAHQFSNHRPFVHASVVAAAVTPSSYSLGKPSHNRLEIKTAGCTCKKSRCLKLYCLCFASSTTCGLSCRCGDCQNTVNHGGVIEASRKAILQRNPNAFADKARVIEAAHDEASVSKMDQAGGCKCKKSFCLKKYCECFSNSKYCSITCKCDSCQNTAPSEKSKKHTRGPPTITNAWRPHGTNYYHEAASPMEASANPGYRYPAYPPRRSPYVRHQHQGYPPYYSRPSPTPHPPRPAYTTPPIPREINLDPRQAENFERTEGQLDYRMTDDQHPRSQPPVHAPSSQYDQISWYHSRVRMDRKERHRRTGDHRECENRASSAFINFNTSSNPRNSARNTYSGEECGELEFASDNAAIPRSCKAKHETRRSLNQNDVRPQTLQQQDTNMNLRDAENHKDHILLNQTCDVERLKKEMQAMKSHGEREHEQEQAIEKLHDDAPTLETQKKSSIDQPVDRMAIMAAVALTELFREPSQRTSPTAELTKTMASAELTEEKKRKVQVCSTGTVKKQKESSVYEDTEAPHNIVSTSPSLLSTESRNPSPVSGFNFSYTPPTTHQWSTHGPAPRSPTHFNYDPRRMVSGAPLYSMSPHAYTVSPPPTTSYTPYEQIVRTTGLPKSLSFRKICSKCGKTRGEHGELGFGNKCEFQECGKCGAASHWHKKFRCTMGFACQLTVAQGAIPGAARAYDCKIRDLAERANLQQAIKHEKQLKLFANDPQRAEF